MHGTDIPLPWDRLVREVLGLTRVSDARQATSDQRETLGTWDAMGTETQWNACVKGTAGVNLIAIRVIISVGTITVRNVTVRAAVGVAVV